MITATKVRLRFAKRDDLRLVSHHDLMRCLERMLRRAAIPMAHSQGFNPRPKVVFTLALALGIEGRREVVELELAEPMEPAELLRRLAAAAPPGFVWLDAEAVPQGRAAQPDVVHYALDVPAARRPDAEAALAAFLASTEWPYTRVRPDRTLALDLRPFVLDAELDPLGVLRFRIKMLPGGSARPEEVIDALGLRDLLAQGSILIRTEVELLPEPRWVPAVERP
jgi:radical SAM-linked protein